MAVQRIADALVAACQAVQSKFGIDIRYKNYYI